MDALAPHKTIVAFVLQVFFECLSEEPERPLQNAPEWPSWNDMNMAILEAISYLTKDCDQLEAIQISSKLIKTGRAWFDRA